jgi:putative heme-binding domain-containing protein
MPTHHAKQAPGKQCIPRSFLTRTLLHPKASAIGSLCRAALCLFALFIGRPAFAGEDVAPDTNRSTIALEALSRLKGIDLDSNPAVKSAVLKILEQLKGTQSFVEIVRDFGIKDQDAALLDYATRNPNSSSGVEAAGLVLSHKNLDLLKATLAGTNAGPLLQALGHVADRDSIGLIQPLVGDLSRTVAIRREAVLALAQMHEGATALIEMARAGSLPDDMKFAAATALQSARWEDVKNAAATALPMPKALNDKPLPPIPDLVAMTGDPAKGAAVFRRPGVACISCHQVNGEGTEFGPNLSEIGTKLPKDALYVAILDPSAGIAFGYEAWEIEMKDGDEALGLIVSETPEELAIKVVGGIVKRFKKSEIARRTQQKLSIMPAGLQQTMSTQDLVDLVEYLTTLKKAR